MIFEIRTEEYGIVAHIDMQGYCFEIAAEFWGMPYRLVLPRYVVRHARDISAKRRGHWRQGRYPHRPSIQCGLQNVGPVQCRKNSLPRPNDPE